MTHSRQPAVAALDIGTSSVRASLFDTAGQPIPDAFSQRMHEPHTSPEGESTLDADALVESAVACLKDISHSGQEIIAVGVDTFWHSMLGVDGAGRACTPIYLWNDTRSSQQVEELRRQLDERAVHARTGCLFHTSYLSARLLWLRQTERDLFDRVKCWLSPGEYLLLQLFGDRRCTLSMASGTGLLNQTEMRWDNELLEAIGIPEAKLAPLCDLDAPFQGLRGRWGEYLSGLATIPWYGPLGDGACSNVGSGGVAPNRITLMVGTSGALRLLGELPQPAPWGLWKYRLNRRRALIGGALSNGGSVYQWLNRVTRLPPREDQESFLADAKPDGHGLTVLPFLWGERSPDWYSKATGAMLGLTAATGPLEILQASLEAVAYRFAMTHQLLAPLADPDHLMIGTGGALSQSPAWAQILVDVIGRPMVLPAGGEGSSRGAALVALEALGLLSSLPTLDTVGLTAITPDSERHAVYAQAIERHRDAAGALMKDPG